MERVPKILAVIALGLAVIAIPTDADARPRQARTVAERLAICDVNYINCGQTCDQTIDIGTAVADCNKRCDARYARCLKWAKTKAMIVQPDDEDGGILVGPNMSLSSDAPAGSSSEGDDSGGDDTGGGTEPFLY